MIRGLTTGRRAALALATCLLPAGLAEAAGPDFADRQDFAFADRGFVAQRSDPLIKAADGRVVWDLDAYRFLHAPAPATVNPSLWRQAQLLSKSGLYKVADGVWQVRGFDLGAKGFGNGAGRAGARVLPAVFGAPPDAVRFAAGFDACHDASSSSQEPVLLPVLPSSSCDVRMKTIRCPMARTPKSSAKFLAQASRARGRAASRP